MNKELYSVEKILQRRQNPTTGEREYKIKWKGYPYSQCTWEPFYHLAYVKQWVDEFDQNEDKKKQQPEKTHKIHKFSKKKQVEEKVDATQKEEQSAQIQREGTKKEKKQLNLKIALKIKQNPPKIKKSANEEKEHKQQKKDNLYQKQSHSMIERDKQEDALIDSELEQEIEVIQMAQNEQDQLFFYVKFPQQLKWIHHKVMKSEYQLQLINFYEKYLTFEDGFDEQSDQQQI